jgi:hypothetical protein
MRIASSHGRSGAPLVRIASSHGRGGPPLVRIASSHSRGGPPLGRIASSHGRGRAPFACIGSSQRRDGSARLRAAACAHRNDLPHARMQHYKPEDVLRHYGLDELLRHARDLSPADRARVESKLPPAVLEVLRKFVDET